jgi:hypothetical protein
MHLPAQESFTEFLSRKLLQSKFCNTPRYTPTNQVSSYCRKSFEFPPFARLSQRFDSGAEIAMPAMLLPGIMECLPGGAGP